VCASCKSTSSDSQCRYKICTLLLLPDVATLKIFACVIDGSTVLSLRVITGLWCVWVEHVYRSEFVGGVVVAVTVEVSTFYDGKLLPVRVCRAKRV
jgi:hypothetical protein